MDLKKPTTFDEQLVALKSHGIIINDDSSALNILNQISYYRLTGYALQYRIDSNNSDCIPGTTLGQIYSIYLFDQDLRGLLRKYLEITEVFLKTLISNGFALIKCTVPPYDQHYDERNYYNKAGFLSVIDSFSKEKNFYKDSLIFQHHNTKYQGKMPLWAMVELLSFSNVSKLYSSMYISDQERIANYLGISSGTLVNHIHCLSVLRNRCAHCARLYNTVFNPPARFNTKYLQKHPEVFTNTLFAYIIVLLKRLPDIEQKKNLILDFESLLQHYPNVDVSLIGVPDNCIDLLKQLVK